MSCFLFASAIRLEKGVDYLARAIRKTLSRKIRTPASLSPAAAPFESPIPYLEVKIQVSWTRFHPRVVAQARAARWIGRPRPTWAPTGRRAPLSSPAGASAGARSNKPAAPQAQTAKGAPINATSALAVPTNTNRRRSGCYGIRPDARGRND